MITKRQKNISRSMILAGMVVLSGCAVVTPERMSISELTAQSKTDLATMFQGETMLSKPLTIEAAIKRVLTKNLDARTQVLEENLALGQVELDRLDFLPKVKANAGYEKRSQFNATNSQTVGSSAAPGSYSYSADQASTTADLSLTWNILDFGTSYYNAHQNANRALIAHERLRKVANNLIRETQFAFWRAAVSQMLAERVIKGIAEAEVALGQIRSSSKAGGRNPVEALRLRKTLLESLRQLENIDQELSTAKIELATLINLPPNAKYTLAIPQSGVLPVPQLKYSLDQMEMMAFTQNPDIIEQGYQTRIAIDETKKAIMQMLPGVTFSLGANFDGNSFLDKNRWNEYGAQLSLNIFDILSAPQRIKHSEAAQEIANSKRLSIRLAVLAQVHIAQLQFFNAKKQFGRADELWTIEMALEQHSLRRSQNNAQSSVDRVVAQTSAIAAELQRYQLYAQLQAALANVQATIGKSYGDSLEAAASKPVKPAPQDKPAVVQPSVMHDKVIDNKKTSFDADLKSIGNKLVSFVRNLFGATKAQAEPVVN
ncbi:MAG: TolC family protein [Magnetovibrio sp.]|nr:TolC family protein [Magnetovibrio sp.]